MQYQCDPRLIIQITRRFVESLNSRFRDLGCSAIAPSFAARGFPLSFKSDAESHARPVRARVRALVEILLHFPRVRVAAFVAAARRGLAFRPRGTSRRNLLETRAFLRNYSAMLLLDLRSAVFTRAAPDAGPPK